MEEDSKTAIKVIVSVLLSVIIFVLTLMFGLPRYNVWSSGLQGESELKRAEWSRQIAVREAQAKKDSSVLLAQAEIERAKGVAQANKIIGDSLKENEQYLRYLWIDSISQTKDQVIYVPTEGQLPILEAGKRK